MAKAGDVIENPITGEKIVFIQTAKETNGELLEFDLYVRPSGYVAAEHIHPMQDEEFEVRAGRLALFMNGKKTIGETGCKATVPAGTPHIWVNDGDDVLHCRVSLRPALQWEQMFETLFGLAKDGKTDKKGLPNPLRLAVITGELKDHAWLASPSTRVQKLAFTILRPIGRWLGYKAEHSKYTDREREVANMLLVCSSNAEIASRLQVTEITVKKHLGRVYDKANVKNKAEFLKKLMSMETYDFTCMGAVPIHFLNIRLK